MLSKYSILDEVSFDLIKKEPSVVYYITCLLESLKYLLKIHIHYLGKNFEGNKKTKKNVIWQNKIAERFNPFVFN